jgi:hypothetical protein
MYCACNENKAGKLNIICCICERNTEIYKNLHYNKKCTGLVKTINCNFSDIFLFTPFHQVAHHHQKYSHL